MNIIACSLLLLSAVTTAIGTSCNCGWINKGRIVGGEETRKNRYPMMVALEKTYGGEVFCGGTIITPWHVLTAAHCTQRSPASITVRVGAHDLRDPSRRHAVAKIINHERYNHVLTIFDIALLVLKSRIEFSQDVGPACLPTGRLQLTGNKLKALGWGRTAGWSKTSAVLREVDLDVIPFKECQESWKTQMNILMEEINLCTYTLNKDTCKGDSGGPLLWLDASMRRYTLAALVSYGAACAGSLPAVNTDVSALNSWIHDNIAASKPGEKACTRI